uniref:Ion_trans domain-containing protein n=1 Tax=Macrostomum lignano TaxID=282301 RepID=A0A1I8HB35_9PLAT
GYRYFLKYETYLYLALIGTTAVFMWPPNYEPCLLNWACGVFSIALTWGVFLFQMQNLPYAGIYALMFEDVVKTLLRALSVFFFLLMGFSLSFYISNRSMEPFRTFDKSFLKTFDMSLGEYEYVSYFQSINGIFKQYAQTISVFFAIIASVALINLLVGLAVGDIETIRRSSSTKLIAVRVQLINEMQSIFPRWLQKRLHQNTMKLYPNKRRQRSELVSWLLNSAYEQAYVKAELRMIGRSREDQFSAELPS